MDGQLPLPEDQCLALVLDFIHNFFERAKIGADDDLIKSEVLDSLRTVELVYFLEGRLKLTLPARALNEKTLRTPRAIAKMLSELGALPVLP